MTPPKNVLRDTNYAVLSGHCGGHIGASCPYLPLRGWCLGLGCSLHPQRVWLPGTAPHGGLEGILMTNKQLNN